MAVQGDHGSNQRRVAPRLAAFGIVIVLAVAGLGLRLFQLQFSHAAEFHDAGPGVATTRAVRPDRHPEDGQRESDRASDHQDETDRVEADSRHIRRHGVFQDRAERNQEDRGSDSQDGTSDSSSWESRPSLVSVPSAPMRKPGPD